MKKIIAIWGVGLLSLSVYGQSFGPRQDNPFSLTNCGDYNNAMFGDLDNDGDIDILSSSTTGPNFYYYENVGTPAAPNYAPFTTNPFGLTTAPANYPMGDLVDIDSDGDLDIMAPSIGGDYYFWENTGTIAAPAFAAPITNPFGLANNGEIYSWGITFGDLDNDGDLDMMSGDNTGDTRFYENTGTATVPTFAAAIINPFGIVNVAGTYNFPGFEDIDNDGDLDLFQGSQNTNWYYFENTGTIAAPAYGPLQTNPFGLTVILSAYVTPNFADLDNDGDQDVMSGNNSTHWHYYENISAAGANHYWVGGSGDWSDAANHWSSTSGGAPGTTTVPTFGNNAVFDDNSGLTAVDIVNIDVAAEADTLTFAAVSNAFVFNNAANDITIEHSLIGNASGVTFTGTWGEVIFNPSTVGEIITSGGTTWQQDFRMLGTEAMTTTDNLDITSGTMFVDDGGLDLAANNLTCFEFHSTTPAAKTINIGGGSTVSVTNGLWDVNGAGLTLTSAGSSILLGDNAGTASFTGGSLAYDTLRSTSATDLSYFNDNSFKLFAVPISSELSIKNGDDLSTDSLIANGVCGAPLILNTTGAGQNGTLTKTGYPLLSLASINVIDVDAIAPAVYNLQTSTLSGATGWTLVGTTYYWIGDGGNWSDANHWSFSTGGPVAGCTPYIPDTVIFDNLSFTAAGEVVLIDSLAQFSKMDWTTTAFASTLDLDTNIVSYGNVDFYPELYVTRDSLQHVIQFVDQADFNPSSSYIDCNIAIQTNDTTDVVQLFDNLDMSDTSSILNFNGKFFTQNFNINTGSIWSINDSGSGADQRTFDLGASTIDLKVAFKAAGDTTIVFDAGTSNIFIGDSASYQNALESEGLTFNNVSLYFTELAVPVLGTQIMQKVYGDNTFDELRILPGSYVFFEEGSTQTIIDSLYIKGTCADSIFISSTDTIAAYTVANFDVPTAPQAIIQCTDITGMNNNTATLTALFSNDNAGNTATWSFPATVPVTAAFTAAGPYCWGDTTAFTNTSSSYSGAVNYDWNYNDGSYVEDTAALIQADNSIQLNFPQPAGIDTTTYGQINTWTEILDGQNLFTPATGAANTTAGNESMRYDFTVGYRFSLVNASADTAFLVDMDVSATDVAYNFKPKLKIYKNGTASGAGSPVNTFPTFGYYEDTTGITMGPTELGADTVSFSVTAFNLLPTDELTIHMGADVSWLADAIQPRWKSDTLTTAGDVQVSYRIDIDTIYFEAVPITSSYNVDTLLHQFQTSGDSIMVTMIATDPDNLCSDTLTVPVDIYLPTVSMFSSDIDATICAGDEVVMTAISSDTAGVTYQFYVNGTSVQGPSVTDTLASSSLVDQDTISVTAWLNSCPSIDSTDYIFNVNPLPVFSWTSSDADTSICDQDSVYFDATSTDPTHTYQYLLNYSGVTLYTLPGEYATNTLVDNDTISLVGYSTDGCRDTLDMIFNVDPLPGTTLADDQGGSSIICEGTDVTFTSTGADTYEFFIDGISLGAPSATSTISIDSLETGEVVSVIGYTTAGCSKEAASTFSYIVTPLPSVGMTSSDADTSICAGETVVFSANGASQYDFIVNGVFAQQGPSSSYTTDTLANNDVIHVIGTSGGCSSSSDTLIFEVLALPTTTLTVSPNDTVCEEVPISFTATGGTNYEFFINGVSQGAPSATNTFAPTTLNPGNVVSVNGESNGCIVSQNIPMTILPAPSVGLFSDEPDSTICDGEAITLTGANATNYDLYVNGVLTTSQASPTFVNPALPVGTNTVYLIGTGANGCTDTSQTILTIYVNPIPTVTLSSSDADDIICAGESVTFTGSGSNQYQFFIDGIPQGSMSATDNLTTTDLLNGQVVDIIGSSLGCTSTSNSITMTVNPVPTVTLTSTDVNNVFCEDESVDFTANGATNYEFFVDGVSQGPPSATNTLNSLGLPVGTYPISVMGESANCTNSASNTVTINALPTATLTSSDIDNIICQGESVTYTATGGTQYEFFVNGVTQGPPSPLTTFTTAALAAGDVVSVDVYSSAGCTDSDTYAAVTVNPNPTVSIASSDIDYQICLGDNVDFTGSGATDYEFFINGVSQGPPSPTTVLSTAGLANGDVISVEGTTNGCSTLSSDLTFTVFGHPIVSLVNNSTDTEICVGENTDLEAFGATNYEFFVNGVSQGAPSATSIFTSPLNNGDIVTVAGETNGCASNSADSYTYVVYNYPTLSSTTSTGTTICVNDLVTVTASGAMTYDFELNGNIVQSGATTTYDINTLEDGDVITVTGYNGDCASTTDTYTFTVNTMALDLTVSPSTMICNGDAVTFTATGADQYEFFLNGTSTGPMSATNTYTTSLITDNDEVTFTAYNTTTMCTQPYEDYILMNVIDEPTITPLSATDFCEGDSVVLTSNSSYGNQWYVDGTPIAGATDTSYVAYTSGAYSLGTISGGQGDVWSFGHNADGTFGDGGNIDNADPTAAVQTQQFDEITSGYGFVLGVTTTGELYAWGDNSSGQLGDGTYTASNVPQIVPTLAGVKTAATTETSSMAVLNTGDVYVWGNNAQGQLGTGNTAVINFPFLNAAIANTDSIAGGRDHFVILKNDGTVWAVGNNDYGQLGQGNLTSSMNPVQVPGLTNVVSVGAGEYHSFAIDNLGDLYVWGNNGSGQLGLGDLNNRLDPTLSSLRDIVNAQGGASHSAFLSSDNKVYTAGANGFGQLGSGNYSDTLLPLEVNISGANMISTGQYTTLVKRADNSVFGFGNNTEDQLSSPSGLTIPAPEHITDLDGVVFIEASQSSSHVIYGFDQSCVSQNVNVNVFAVPVVSITANVDTLSTIAGASYQWYFNGNPIPGATNQTYVANNSGNYSVEVTFANGCIGYSPDYYHSMSGIHEGAFGLSRLYPNPTKTSITIEFLNTIEGDIDVEIRDQAGRIVYNDVHFQNNQLTIDVSALQNGVYYITCNGEGQVFKERFVKIDQ